MRFDHVKFPLKQATTAALSVVAAVVLVACGGSTVTSEDLAEESSTMPTAITTAPATEESDATSPEASPTAVREQSEASASNAAPPAPVEQGAREISEIPAPAPEWSDPEAQYLEAVATAGVDIAGQESVLLGTAQSVCAEGLVSEATPGAVAGQLRAQGRTELPIEELTEVLTVNARTILCP